MAVKPYGPKTYNKNGFVGYTFGHHSKPYQPTSYRLEAAFGSLDGKNNPPVSPTGDLSLIAHAWTADIPTVNAEQAVNDALARLRNKIETNSGLIETLVERQASIDLAVGALRATNRSMRAFMRAFRALKRNPAKAGEILKQVPQSLHEALGYPELSSIPSAYLALNFGVIPTISSVNDTLKVLTGEEQRLFTLRARARSHHRFPEGPKVGSTSRMIRGKQTHYCVIGGKIESINPNAILAQRLGFTSPSLAWELVPWSWFIDYFTNLGELLANLDPSPPGLNFVDQYYTVFTKGNYAWKRNRVSIFDPPDGSAFQAMHLRMVRSIGWPSATLEAPSLRRLSLTKLSYAVSAIALTVKGFERYTKHGL